MSNDTQLTYKPTSVVHPGESVVEYLEFNGWSQSDLARRTGLTRKTISEICNSKSPITPNTALALERVFQRPAHLWLNLQRQFDEAKARELEMVKLDSWTEWAAKFPISRMREYLWIDPEETGKSEVEILLNFFGVSSPDSWDSVWQACNPVYRQTRKFSATKEVISAWVRETEICAAAVDVAEFNENVLKSCVGELRGQSTKRAEKFIGNVQSLCASAGVAVVFVPELPSMGISGCARWLTDKKAMIGLSMRYKTDDQLWFTLFHEIGHLLLHKKEMGFVLDNDVEGLMDKTVDPQMQKREEEANRFAADTLIPPEQLFRFIQKNNFSSGSILSFSEELNIGPGIVVGRLQHEGLLRFSQGNKLKQYLQFNFSSK